MSTQDRDIRYATHAKQLLDDVYEMIDEVCEAANIGDIERVEAIEADTCCYIARVLYDVVQEELQRVAQAEKQDVSHGER